MKKYFYSAGLFLLLMLVLWALGSLTYYSLVFLMGKDIPFYFFAWVFILYMSLIKGDNKK